MAKIKDTEITINLVWYAKEIKENAQEEFESINEEDFEIIMKNITKTIESDLIKRGWETIEAAIASYFDNL